MCGFACDVGLHVVQDTWVSNYHKINCKKLRSDILLAYSRHPSRIWNVGRSRIEIEWPIWQDVWQLGLAQKVNLCGPRCVRHRGCVLIQNMYSYITVIKCLSAYCTVVHIVFVMELWVHRSMPLWKQRSVLLSSHDMYKYESRSLLTVLTQTKDKPISVRSFDRVSDNHTYVRVMHFEWKLIRRLDRHSLFGNREITGGRCGQNTSTFSLHTKITQCRKLTRRYFVSYVIVGCNLEIYCHAAHYSLFTYVYVWHRYKNTPEIQNSILFCISFVFTLWSFYCGQGFTEGSSVWQLALCQVHTRTCSHCIPRCPSMCMCACTCACMYLCTHLHMHNRYLIVFTSVMNSNVLISTNYRPLPFPTAFWKSLPCANPRMKPYTPVKYLTMQER